MLQDGCPKSLVILQDSKKLDIHTTKKISHMFCKCKKKTKKKRLISEGTNYLIAIAHALKSETR